MQARAPPPPHVSAAAAAAAPVAFAVLNAPSRPAWHLPLTPLPSLPFLCLKACMPGAGPAHAQGLHPSLLRCAPGGPLLLLIIRCALAARLHRARAPPRARRSLLDVFAPQPNAPRPPQARRYAPQAARVRQTSSRARRARARCALKRHMHTLLSGGACSALLPAAAARHPPLFTHCLPPALATRWATHLMCCRVRRLRFPGCSNRGAVGQGGGLERRTQLQAARRAPSPRAPPPRRRCRGGVARPCAPLAHATFVPWSL